MSRDHDTRVTELLAANNAEVERRRAAEALLRECGDLFRMYETSHRAKGTPDGTEKAERNRVMAERIERLLAAGKQFNFKLHSVA